ncbi:MAG: hypothetical protein RLZZ15_4423 [Verrucomicrobiota bacterium]|jgi:cell division protein FtsI/penicillin-binding protein 2
MSTGFASNCRTGLLAFGVLGGFTVVGARLYCLHVLDRRELLKPVEADRHHQIVEHAVRGNVLDVRSAILATSRAVYTVGYDPASILKPNHGTHPEDRVAQRLFLRDRRKWPELARLLGLSLAELREILLTAKPRATAAAAPDLLGATPSAALAKKSPPAPADLRITFVPPPATSPGAHPEDAHAAGHTASGPRWIKLFEDIPPATAAAINELNVHGVYVPPPTYRRVYPHKQLGAHVLGYVNHEEEPVTGLERFADFYLRGQDGWRVGEKDGHRIELAQFRSRDVAPAHGFSVRLSLDANVQDIVERELADLAARYQPEKATIIVSDPRDGFILALANYPAFDPNEYNKVPTEEMRRLNNVALGEVYEPGSVFKIVAAAGALQERLVTPGSSFDCGIDRIDYLGKVRGLPREDHHFGRLTVAEIIAHSSNRGAAQLAMQLGDRRFYDYARAFGFGEVTGLLGSLEAPRYRGGKEEPGNLRDPKMWDGLTITRMPMGHSVDVTALQMHQAMSVIASGGVRLRPQIIRDIRDTAGNIVRRYDRAELNRAISPATAATMARLLMAVASKEGTAPEAAIPGYEVAGKTGTTQKLEDLLLPDGRKTKTYSSRHHVASFVGFFPASRPQLVISVIVDDADAHAPNGVAYGSKVAAPSFKRIAEQLITYRDIKSGPAPTAGVLALQGNLR